MSALFRACHSAAGELVEETDGEEALYVREPGAWLGEVRVHRGPRDEHATLHLEGLPEDVVVAVLRTLREEAQRYAVENDRATFDHEAEPGRNLRGNLERVARLVDGLGDVLDG